MKKTKKTDEPFIIHYSIDENEIKIIYSNEEVKVFPYSKEKAIEVSSSVKNQIQNINELKKELIKQRRFDLLFVLLGSAYIMVNGLILSSSVPNIKIINIITLYASSLATSYFGFSLIRDEIRIDNLEKDKNDLENQVLLNLKKA